MDIDGIIDVISALAGLGKILFYIGAVIFAAHLIEKDEYFALAALVVGVAIFILKFEVGAF